MVLGGGGLLGGSIEIEIDMERERERVRQKERQKEREREFFFSGMESDCGFFRVSKRTCQGYGEGVKKIFLFIKICSSKCLIKHQKRDIYTHTTTHNKNTQFITMHKL